jgi:hexulose-6-phosphate isomerase
VGNVNGFVGLLEGDIDWPKVMDALVAIGYNGYVTAEVPPLKHHNEALIWKTSKAMDFILRT